MERASATRNGKEAPSPRRRGRVARIVLSTVFVTGAVAAIFGNDGLLELRRLERSCERLEARLERQERRNERLADDVRRARDEDAARERLARERLGYGRPGEVQFLLPRSARDGVDNAPPAPRPFRPDRSDDTP